MEDSRLYHNLHNHKYCDNHVSLISCYPIIAQMSNAFIHIYNFFFYRRVTSKRIQDSVVSFTVISGCAKGQFSTKKCCLKSHTTCTHTVRIPSI